MKQPIPNNKRVRGTLLVLLWIWAICIFVVVDLFLNVEEFDRIRPKARVYRSMRFAAHDMVDEPYYDNDFGPSRAGYRISIARRADSAAPASAQAHYLADELARVPTLRLSELRAMATDADDPRLRIAALRAMASDRMRPAILNVALNEAETNKVRAEAALLIGRTGPDGLAVIEKLIRTEDLPRAVRAGAVRGLGELGSSRAARQLLEIAAGTSFLRLAADRGVAQVARPEALPLLVDAARSTHLRKATRIAACRALGRSRRAELTHSLAPLLADDTQPAELRAAVAHAMGLSGDSRALAVVSASTRDHSPQVAQAARLATTRLSHLR